jgi:aryl-alcohol dehydrogenase-like predicted oxidoreductase
MQCRKLGGTDISVSVITMGCWAIVGDATWGPQDEQDSIETIAAALDAGVSFFDTAESYGDGYSERLLAKALDGRRGEAVIASKVSPGNLTREGIRRACEGSLARLATDYIDLYQIHWPSRTVPLEESMGALEELKTEGKIRAIGVSNFASADLDDLIAAGRAETDQLAYSMLFRAVEYGIRDKCIANGIGIMCYCPLAQGLLTGKFRTPDEVPAGRARTRMFAKTRPQARHQEEGAEAEVFEALVEIRRICEETGEPMERMALAWLVAQPGVLSAVSAARAGRSRYGRMRPRGTCGFRRRFSAACHRLRRGSRPSSGRTRICGLRSRD